MDTRKFEAALSVAQEAFWQRFAEEHGPDLVSGDVTPEMAGQFDRVTRDVAREYVRINTPEPKTVCTIELDAHEAVEIVVDGCRLRASHVTDGDGEHAVQLGGVDCRLDGEMPGLYYLAPLGDGS